MSLSRIFTLSLPLLAVAGCIANVGPDSIDPGAETVQTAEAPVIKSRADAIQVMNEISDEMAQLRALQAQMAKDFAALSTAASALNKQSGALAAAASSGNSSQLLEATKQMQETQISFNLQYLQLQSQMQHENRSYTAISNIMKTKHDTVKNSISNIR